MARGLPSIRRVHAKNYIHEEAQARLQEVIPAARKQGMNALGVDYHEALLFLKQFSSTVCTCRETEVDVQEEYTENSVRVKNPTSVLSDSEEIVVDWGSPLFGDASEYTHEEDQATANDYELEDEPSEFRQTTVMGTTAIDESPACGVCYRTGFVPGFQQWGQTRVVLTTNDIIGESGFVLNKVEAPHKFVRLTRNGYVEFELDVPKYFKSANYSIRNNFDQTMDTLHNQDGTPLTLDDLKQGAGKKVVIKLYAEVFTHVVIVFDLGSEPVRVNLAQMSKATDWTQFDAISNMNIILPTTIPEVTNGSIVLIPKIKLALRITDVQFLKTASGFSMDWSCGTRVLQPMEPLKHIGKGIRIL